MKPFAFPMTLSVKILLGSLMVASALTGRSAEQTLPSPVSQTAGGLAGSAGNPAAAVGKAVDGAVGKADKDAVFRKDLGDAKMLAKGNNIAAAEQALTRSNGFQKDTPEWHFETTQKLMQAAHDLSKEGKNSEAATRALAVQSLQHLTDVAAIAKDNATKSKAKSGSAFIQDRYLGDPTAAIASYQAALQLTPNDPAVKEALDRLQKADANLRAKIRAKTK